MLDTNTDTIKALHTVLLVSEDGRTMRRERWDGRTLISGLWWRFYVMEAMCDGGFVVEDL